MHITGHASAVIIILFLVGTAQYNHSAAFFFCEMILMLMVTCGDIPLLQ